MSATAVENQILAFLRTIGVYAWKNAQPDSEPYSPYHIIGSSNVLGVIQGRMLAIKVAAKGETVKSAERIFVTRVNSEGGIAFITRSLENCIEQLLKFFPENKPLQQFAKEYIQSNGMDH